MCTESELYGLDRPPFKELISWNEAVFDFANQLGIAGEYRGWRQAARIRKRVENITYADRCAAEFAVMQWFKEKEMTQNRIDEMSMFRKAITEVNNGR